MITGAAYLLTDSQLIRGLCLAQEITYDDITGYSFFITECNMSFTLATLCKRGRQLWLLLCTDAILQYF